MTTGSDGNLWFVEIGTNKLGKITPDGTISETPVPSGSADGTIISGPDGALWFTEGKSNQIGRMQLGK
jgi:virginiamycin B lyase